MGWDWFRTVLFRVLFFRVLWEAGFGAKDLTKKIRSSLDAEFFGQNAQAGVGGDEVYMLNAVITLDRQQELAEKD
jgi:hypothetical protein